MSNTEGIAEAEIEVKILHLLGIYPIISPTMLQGGLGPSVKPALWRPVLARLINEAKVGTLTCNPGSYSRTVVDAAFCSFPPICRLSAS